jgi:hypothetical protein
MKKISVDAAVKMVGSAMCQCASIFIVGVERLRNYEAGSPWQSELE